MPIHEKIDYVEFPASDMDKIQQFFREAFGWNFADYGEQYSAFFRAEAGLDGGFFKSDLTASSATGGALIVFYSENIEQTETKIIAAKGSVLKPVFSFPGGRRLHFADPCDNEYGLWSDRNADGTAI